MDTQETKKPYSTGNDWSASRQNRSNGAIVGIFLVLIGVLSIARKMGAPMPEYIFTWPMLLIGIGLVVGIQTRFRSIGWLIPILIGSFFLLDDVFPQFLPRDFFLPAALIVVGILFIFGRSGKNMFCSKPNQQTSTGENVTGSSNFEGAAASDDLSDRMNESVIFGNVRKNVISKHFTGGEVSAVFAGAEINLLHGDLAPGAKLELNAVFGGIKLIVPSHWQIKLKSNAVLGGVEDKRPRHTIYSDKILILEANAVFGGIEIQSY